MPECHFSNRGLTKSRANFTLISWTSQATHCF